MSLSEFAGAGLRPPHYDWVLRGESKLKWFEVISENFIDSKGRPLHILEKVREKFPMALHGVSLNIGSPDPVDLVYLKRLKELYRIIQPRIISDHLCWGGLDGRNWHDLLPVPMTSKMVKHISKKVRQVQETLETTFALENISTYLTFKEDELTEGEFISAIVEETKCHLLFDINNAYVNAFNHGFDAKDLIDRLPAEAIVQYHLAGHTNYGTFLFDTHDHDVIDPVWELFRYTLKKIGPRPFIIERDAEIPAAAALEQEVAFADKILQESKSDREELKVKNAKQNAKIRTEKELQVAL